MKGRDSKLAVVGKWAVNNRIGSEKRYKQFWKNMAWVRPRLSGDESSEASLQSNTF